MKQSVYIFGGISITLFFLFQLSKYCLYFFDNSFSGYLLFLAAITFITIGFYFSRIIPFHGKSKSQKIRKDSRLSRQEYKILCLMNEGLSNYEIAENLFIAESTVKKHVSNILNKLKAKRRTEALKIGRELEII